MDEFFEFCKDFVTVLGNIPSQQQNGIATIANLVTLPANGLKILGYFEKRNDFLTKSFEKKIIKFLNGISTIPVENREKFISKVEYTFTTHSERLLTIINKIDDNKKIEYIVNLFKALVNEKIDFSLFFRLCNCIEISLSEDLLYIKEEIDNKEIFENLQLQFLEKNNLVKKLTSTPMVSKIELSQGNIFFKYNFTDFARLLDKYALSYEDDKYNYSINELESANKKIEIPAGTILYQKTNA